MPANGRKNRIGRDWFKEGIIVLIRPLFEKYQEHILAFANTDFGKDHLDIETKDRIVKLTPDSWRIRIGENQYQETFYSKSPYLKKLEFALDGLEIIEEAKLRLRNVNPEFIIPHFQGLHYHPGLPLLMRETLTVYPDAHAETTTVDGEVGHDETVSWTALKAKAGNEFDDTAVDIDVFSTAAGAEPNWQWLRKGIMLFDILSLTTVSAILGATFSLYGTSKSDDTSSTPDLNVYESAPASDTALANGDFDSLSTTPFCDTPITYAGFDDNGWNDWVFNSDGKTFIETALAGDGIVKLGTRNAKQDVGAGSPTWASGADLHFKVRSADSGSNKPKLVVTYLVPIPHSETNKPVFFRPEVVSY